MADRKSQTRPIGWQLRMLMASFLLRAILRVWPDKSANVVCAIAVLNVDLMVAE